MNKVLEKVFIRELEYILSKVKAGNCDLNDEEGADMIHVMTHEPMNKETACRYLNMSRAKFDSLVAFGDLPKGRSRASTNIMTWYRDELDDAVKVIKSKK